MKDSNPKRWSWLLQLEKWHAKPIAGHGLFEGLDGIRGLAIFLVISSHSIPFLNMDTPLKRSLSVISSNGTMGVWLFFVLSGFLISLPFFKRLHSSDSWCPPGFAIRRAAKVIPPLYLSIILLTAVFIHGSHSWVPVRGALETMLFFHIFVWPNPVITPIYWSLAAEVAFYLFLPVLFFTLRPLLRKHPWIVPVVLIGLSAVTWMTTASNPTLQKSTPFIHDVLLSFVFFGWGALFACVYVAKPAAPFRHSALCVLAGAVGFFACGEISGHYWLAHQAYIGGLFSYLFFTNAVGLCAALMLFVVQDSRALMNRVLCSPLLILCGLVSYEWYLFHLLFIGFSKLITGDDLHGSFAKLMVRIFFAFPVSFVFSAVVYRLFSLPILRKAHTSRARA
jgi:peptidoglycan/LPS O-acetylase OafA/YrhL